MQDYLAIDVCLSVDAEIGAHSLPSPCDDDLIIPVFHLCEIQHAGIYGSGYALGHIYVFPFADGDDGTTSIGVGHIDTEFHIVLIRLLDVDPQMGRFHRVQKGIQSLSKLQAHRGMKSLRETLSRAGDDKDDGSK